MKDAYKLTDLGLRLLNELCDYTKVDRNKVLDPEHQSRQAKQIIVRAVMSYYLRYEQHLTLKEVASVIGVEDHTTVSNMLKRAGEVFDDDCVFSHLYYRSQVNYQPLTKIWVTGKVRQLTSDRRLVKTWSSVSAIERHYKTSDYNIIHNAIQNKFMAKGFRWEYVHKQLKD